MNTKANYSLSGILAVLQGSNLSLWSGRLQVIVGVALACVQAVVAAKAHWSNPDGTPAELPYYKPSDKI
jgi:hypothetical protein